MADAGNELLHIVAAAGPTGHITRQARLTISESSPGGRGLSATAFRTGRPCISNDYLADPRGEAFHAIVRNDGAAAAAAFPLFSGDHAVGIIGFISDELDTFTPNLRPVAAPG